MAFSCLYDGSWEGLLTAVFEAFAGKQWPRAILPEENAQLQLGEEAVRIATHHLRAERVEKGIIRRMGSAAHQKIWTAFLSGDPEKSTVIYRYICTGMQMGRGVYSALAHEDVLAMDRLCTHVGGEAHLLRGFVRFAEMENGVFYGKISPKNNVLPLLMPFFADRYNDQPLLLYDDVSHLAGVYDLREWYLVETPDINLPAFSGDELEYRRMWKDFYDNIAIAQRYNPRCRQGHMPRRYWHNLTEFQHMPEEGQKNIGTVIVLSE